MNNENKENLNQQPMNTNPMNEVPVQPINTNPMNGVPVQPMNTNPMNGVPKGKTEIFKWWTPILLLGMLLLFSIANVLFRENAFISIIMRMIYLILLVSFLPVTILTIISCGKKYNRENKESKVYLNNLLISNCSLDEKLLGAYIGENYLKISKEKYSIPTALLGTYYFLYRKFYLVAIIFILLSFTITIFLKVDTLAIVLVSTLLYFIFAIFFNKLYIKFCKKKIKNIKESNPNTTESELINICRKKGGISIIPPIILVAIQIIIMIICFILSYSEVTNIISSSKLDANERSAELLYSKIHSAYCSYVDENEQQPTKISDFMNNKYYSLESYEKITKVGVKTENNKKESNVDCKITLPADNSSSVEIECSGNFNDDKKILKYSFDYQGNNVADKKEENKSEKDSDISEAEKLVGKYYTGYSATNIFSEGLNNDVKFLISVENLEQSDIFTDVADSFENDEIKNINFNIKYIKYDTVLNNAKTLFGEDTTIEKKEYKTCPGFKYFNTSTKGEIFVDVSQCGSRIDEIESYEVLNAEYKENTIEIIVGYIKIVASLDSNSDLIFILDGKEYTNIPKKVLSNYIKSSDNIDKFKLIFKQDKDHYYLDSISITK